MAFHPVLESARFIRTMQLFDHRMYSFEKFPWEVKQIIDVTSLAESGLFYTKLLDKCMCSFCLCVIEGFCLGDTADDRHLKENPDCPFLKKHVKNKFSHEVNKCPIKLDVRYEILDTKVIVGSPERVIDRLTQYKEMLGLTGFTAELNPGGLLPPEAVHRSLKLLTDEVMPAFK